MIVLLLLVVVLLIGLTAAAVMGRIGGFMADPTTSQPFLGAIGGSGDPALSLSVEDMGQLHFAQALRGYRMDQVDEVMDAVSARLRELETEVGSLRAQGVLRHASSDVLHDVSNDAGSDTREL